jgi:hypothetical protein
MEMNTILIKVADQLVTKLMMPSFPYEMRQKIGSNFTRKYIPLSGKISIGFHEKVTHIPIIICPHIPIQFRPCWEEFCKQATQKILNYNNFKDSYPYTYNLKEMCK